MARHTPAFLPARLSREPAFLAACGEGAPPRPLLPEDFHMATQDTKKPGSQPAEDMFGRPTGPRHEEPAHRPAKDAPGEQAPASRQGAEEKDKNRDEEIDPLEQ